MANKKVTATERLMSLSLSHEPNQTVEQLSESTGTRSLKVVRAALRFLVAVGELVASTDAEGITRYRHTIQTPPYHEALGNIEHLRTLSYLAIERLSGAMLPRVLSAQLGGDRVLHALYLWRNNNNGVRWGLLPAGLNAYELASLTGIPEVDIPQVVDMVKQAIEKRSADCEVVAEDIKGDSLRYRFQGKEGRP